MSPARQRRFQESMAGATEKDRVKTSLSEVRTLVLGAQILFGFQYHAVFQPGFPALPAVVQDLHVVALTLLIATLTCLIAPIPFHHIAEGGQAAVRMNAYTKVMAMAALVPFALAIGINVAVALASELGMALAGALGAGAAFGAALCWFGPGLAPRRPAPPEEDEMTSTKHRITELFTEARIILPGVQALLGFQLASYLTEGFAKLPPTAQAVNTASLFLLLLAMILLMAPAPYHRLAERGEDTEHFERVGVRLVLASLPPFALAVAGDAFVVATMVSGRAGGLALTVALGCALAMAALWLGVPMLAARRKLGYGTGHEGARGRER
jgi:Family of unknown function (DUF6328)